MKPLGRLDAAWLHMERPENPMMITAVLWLEGVLTVSQLRRILLERLVARYPRFADRVVRGVGPLPDRWEPDPAFHIDNHLRHVALPAPGSRTALMNLVSDLASERLDLRMSPWQVHLVDGYEGACAVVVRIHHCIADGMALARVLLELTDGGAAIAPSHPAVQARGWSVLEAAQRGAEALLEVEYLASMLPDMATPLQAPLGVRKRCAWAGPISLGEVKHVGEATGCSINDVLVSAVAGAVGDHLARIHAGVPRIRAFVPVNLRPLDEPISQELGNQFAMVVLNLPVGERDPAVRLQRVHEEMEALKRGVEPAVTYWMFQVLGATPTLLEQALVDFFGLKATAVLTNVPGPRKTVFLDGVAVKGVMVWVPQSGPIGLGLSIFSYAGRVWVGVASDVNCLPEPQGVAEGVVASFRALRARVLGTGGGLPRL